ncbi:hypothetical protein AGMMS49938_11020 [Fibrobacterales bacterium]|nr:hypothetical protein AGMMS49938_11020 [Fibrobacterales bacterium]
MELKDVKTKDQFENYFANKNIHNTDEKINNLINTMKIRAIQYDESETPDEKLASLEETALLGFWMAS